MLTSEPGALALGELLRALGRLCDGAGSIEMPSQHLQCFAVANGLQEWQVSSVALLQLLGFFHQPLGIQLFSALTDPLAQVGWIEAEFEHAPGGGLALDWELIGLPVA